MKFNRQNLLLYIALAAPILMIGIVALSIYLPNVFNKPRYDFVYADSYNYKYSIDSNGKLQKIEVQPQPYPPYIPAVTPGNKIAALPPVKFYYYDLQKGAGREISFEEAQKYKLNSNPQSPDGYSIVYGSNSGSDLPFLFYSSTGYGSRYVTGHGVNKKLNLPATTPDYPYYPLNQFIFIGWVLNNNQ